MRLIDADAQIDTAREEFERRVTEAANAGYMYSEMFNEGKIFYAIKNAAINAPTIDAVPVVRCENCMYWNNKNEMCNAFDAVTPYDGYCYFGALIDEEV